MMRERIQYFLKNPDRLGEISRKEISDWLEEMPFYQPLHLLLQQKDAMLNKSGAAFKNATYFSNDIDFSQIEDHKTVISGETYRSDSELFKAELNNLNIASLGLAGAGSLVIQNFTPEYEVVEDIYTLEKTTQNVSAFGVFDNIFEEEDLHVNLEGAGDILALDFHHESEFLMDDEVNHTINLDEGLIEHGITKASKKSDFLDEDMSQPIDHLNQVGFPSIYDEETENLENTSLAKEREVLDLNFHHESEFISEDILKVRDEHLDLDPEYLENKIAETSAAATTLDEDFEIEELLIATGSASISNTNSKKKKDKKKKKSKPPMTKILSLSDIDGGEVEDEDVYIGEGKSEYDMAKKKKDKAKKSDKKKDKNKSSFTQWLSGKKKLKGSDEKKTKKVKAKQKEKEIIKEANKSNFRNESIISETLAEILGKQGHFKESINMYKQLSLLYPEKSSYFASKIDKLKKLSK